MNRRDVLKYISTSAAIVAVTDGVPMVAAPPADAHPDLPQIPEGHRFVVVGGASLPSVMLTRPDLVRHARYTRLDPDLLWLEYPPMLPSTIPPGCRIYPRPPAFAVNADVTVGTIDELVENFRQRLIYAARLQLSGLPIFGIEEEGRQKLQAQLAKFPTVMPLADAAPFWRALDAERAAMDKEREHGST